MLQKSAPSSVAIDFTVRNSSCETLAVVVRVRMQLCCHHFLSIVFHELLDPVSFQHPRRKHLWPITARPLRSFSLQGSQTSVFCYSDAGRFTGS